MPLHVFPWRPESDGADLRRDAFYLVRPDGLRGTGRSRRERRGAHVVSRCVEADADMSTRLHKIGNREHRVRRLAPSEPTRCRDVMPLQPEAEKRIIQLFWGCTA